jgi:hypothetical protein
MVLGSEGLFRPATDNHKNNQARQFFDILNLLPQKHVVHDIAIGLQLPELNGVNQWNYIAASDETLGAFNRALGDLFGSHIFHMRGYGDRLTEAHDHFYREASLALQ